MKKLIFSFALVAVAATSAFAQIPKIGIKGGLNFANVSASTGTGTVSIGTLTTFSAGAFLDLKAGALSIQPGVYYTGKGYKYTDKANSSTAQTNLYYLQIPVDFVYHVPAVVGNVYFGAGPFAAFGLSGKAKATSNGSTTFEQDVTFGDGMDDTKRMEYGLQGVAGFHFNSGFLVGLNYDLGLSNLSNNSTSSKNRVWGVSVGFTF